MYWSCAGIFWKTNKKKPCMLENRFVYVWMTQTKRFKVLYEAYYSHCYFVLNFLKLFYRRCCFVLMLVSGG